MQVVVLKSPKCLRGLLRRLFGIRKERDAVKRDFNQADAMQAAADDDVLASSLKLMDRSKHVYEELAK